MKPFKGPSRFQEHDKINVKTVVVVDEENPSFLQIKVIAGTPPASRDSSEFIIQTRLYIDNINTTSKIIDSSSDWEQRTGELFTRSLRSIIRALYHQELRLLSHPIQPMLGFFKPCTRATNCSADRICSMRCSDPCACPCGHAHWYVGGRSRCRLF